MEAVNTKKLLETINQSTEELHERIDAHRSLMSSVLEQGTDDDVLKKLLFSSISNESSLKEALKETIEVLEETKKAFKSKKLEALRKKLTEVLIES